MNSPVDGVFEDHSQILELQGNTRTQDRRQDSKECRKKNKHPENYEGRISHIRSDISTFSGGNTYVQNTSEVRLGRELLDAMQTYGQRVEDCVSGPARNYKRQAGYH